jgi:hypothetical protein
MATIRAAVGAPPATNRPDDVRVVQDLLSRVEPALTSRPPVTGNLDQVTLDAIREFQRRFMDRPDGRVDPNGRTLMHLNNGSSSRYSQCNAKQRLAIDRGLLDAKHWLEVVNQRLGNPNDADMRQKVQNIFHVNFETSDYLVGAIRSRYAEIRRSFRRSAPFVCESREALEAAIVYPPDQTIHFHPGFFRGTVDERAEDVIHERAHTVLGVHHSGMENSFQRNPFRNADDDSGVTFDQAYENAYCYGWLATALQPAYAATIQLPVIRGSVRP